MERDELFEGIKIRLRGAYGDRLKGVMLFGSEARGEALEDSDYDFLVLLRGPIELGNDIRTIINSTYDLQLEVPRLINILPANIDDFETGKCALYRNVKREGLLL